jgi:hypothetical protein
MLGCWTGHIAKWWPISSRPAQNETKEVPAGTARRRAERYKKQAKKKYLRLDFLCAVARTHSRPHSGRTYQFLGQTRKNVTQAEVGRFRLRSRQRRGPIGNLIKAVEKRAHLWVEVASRIGFRHMMPRVVPLRATVV